MAALDDMAPADFDPAAEAERLRAASPNMTPNQYYVAVLKLIDATFRKLASAQPLM